MSISATLIALAVGASYVLAQASDPCAKVGSRKWVAPADLRACFASFAVDPVIKENIVEVINKTLGFHMSTNYQIQAPPPFHRDVREDVLASLARIRHQTYKSDYDLHIDLSRTLKRLNDGHCVWQNNCYDSLFLNYLPIPLVLLTDSRGSQAVHIAPAAFEVATAEFPDQLQVWQDALPGNLKGKLSSLSGAKVLEINKADPFAAVNANAAITGGYQSFGTRQNSFFSSYQSHATGWLYIMGNFAQESLPLHDYVDLTLQLSGSSKPVHVKLPYRARINPNTVPFTDSTTFRQNNCIARPTTNGVDINADGDSLLPPTPLGPRRIVNEVIDYAPVLNVGLPQQLQPPSPIGNSGTAARFYMLEDGLTGVLALGSFSDASYLALVESLYVGLMDLKTRGAERLVVDATNNGGGFVCVAAYLHRLIIGPADTTIPQAGLNSTARAGSLAQEIVSVLNQDPSIDPSLSLFYNPLNWRNIDHEHYSPDDNWLQPPEPKVINRRQDAFSPRLGNECQPEGWTTPPPDVGLFAGNQVVIINNGRCGSSCSLFSIAMNESQGTKTVVVGGKKDVNQQYCGVVGGQSTSFQQMDTEIKSTGLKNHPLAPPDLLVNGWQGITWRLGFGIDDPTEPAEWQDHTATINLPLTAQTANNPRAIWQEVAKRVFTA